MNSRLMRAISREPFLDWLVVLIISIFLIPAFLGIGLSQPLSKETAFNPLVNPALTIGFILMGQMLGFFVTAWKRGRWVEAQVHPKLGTVLKTMASNFRSDKVALLVVIGVFVGVALGLLWMRAGMTYYGVLMATIVIVSMNSYKRAAWYVNPEGLTKVDPKDVLKFKDQLEAENKR